MNRREIFGGLLALGAACAPLVALAQRQGKTWRVGILQPGVPPEPLVDALREGMRDLGYVEGRDVTFEIRWAEGRLDRLGELMASLIAAKVDLITTFSTPLALAAQRATSTVPIVFTGVGDPVGAGVVPNLARPGGNATGLSTLATELSAKRLEILHEIVPGVSRLAMLWNDKNPSMVLRAREASAAGAKLGVTIQSLGVNEQVDFEAAFVAIRRSESAALLTLADPFTRANRQQIVDLAARMRLPSIYELREFAEAGGLISYGPSLVGMHRRAAVYIDKILKGARPGDLPVEQPSVFELIVNLKTARALGIRIPQSVLLRADRVIE
jgi:putative ABC transport system substrate-binding protein